jgi:ribonuclease P/MRP protein subunit POP3
VCLYVPFTALHVNPFLRPTIPDNVQNAVLARVISVLDGVADIRYQATLEGQKGEKRSGNRGKARQRPEIRQEMRSNNGTEIDGTSRLDILNAIAETAMPDAASQAPSILEHLTFGINQVTKLLESIARSRRHVVASGVSRAEEPRSGPSRLVVVCHRDINPPALIGHLPNLVAACNSSRQFPSSGNPSMVWLVQLPKGAEQTLAAVVGLKRVATIAIEVSGSA